MVARTFKQTRTEAGRIKIEHEKLCEHERRVTAHDITAVGMAYVRFEKQYVAATQVNTKHNCLADILAVDPVKKLSYEIEVKNTKHDLVVLEKKKDKYRSMQPTVTDFYILLVNPSLVETAKVVADHQYGIYTVYSDSNSSRKGRCGPFTIQCVRSAKQLQYSDRYEDLLQRIMLRSTSYTASSLVSTADLIAENEMLRAQNEILAKTLRGYFLT